MCVIGLCAWASCQIRKIAGCACAGNAGNVFRATAGYRSRHASRHVRPRTCRDACRDRSPAVSFELGGGENIPGIPGACATHDFTYLVRGPWIYACIWSYLFHLGVITDIRQNLRFVTHYSNVYLSNTNRSIKSASVVTG